MTDVDRAPGRSAAADMLGVFSVLWALAAVWHLLGNATTAPGWSQLLLMAGVGLVLLNPGAPVAAGALAVASLITVWEEAPLLGNHWLLAGFVHLTVVVAIVVAVLRRRRDDRTDLASRLFPAARLCVIAFYAFAAFAKLNSAFLDRSVSCAVLFFEQSTESLGLEALQIDGNAWLQRGVIGATLLVELAIPVLLVVRRTRALGVMVGLVFHFTLALDRTHQFFDFSAVLFALFLLFLPPSAGTWVHERVGSIRARLALVDERLPRAVHLGLVAVPVGTGAAVALDQVSPERALDVGWAAWQVAAVLAVVATVLLLRQQPEPAAHHLRPHHAVFAVIPLLVVLNGLTPYLELKTGYGWNMYSNLHTADGESNHLLVRRTLPLTDEQADVVEILASSSPELRRYAMTGYGLTWRQLRAFMARHPNDSITYRREGEVVTLDQASDQPALTEAPPAWREKVQLFRAIDLRDPTRCVPTFGAAR